MLIAVVSNPNAQWWLPSVGMYSLADRLKTIIYTLYARTLMQDSDGEGDAGGVEVFPLSQGDVTETDQYSQTQDVGNNTQTASADAEFALTGDNLIPQPRKVCLCNRI